RRFPTSATSGLLAPPPPEVNWRTRRETMLTSTLAFTTFSSACFTRFVFIVWVSYGFGRFFGSDFCRAKSVEPVLPTRGEVASHSRPVAARAVMESLAGVGFVAVDAV